MMQWYRNWRYKPTGGIELITKENLLEWWASCQPPYYQHVNPDRLKQGELYDWVKKEMNRRALLPRAK
jgi:hypothetical protein